MKLGIWDHNLGNEVENTRPSNWYWYWGPYSRRGQPILPQKSFRLCGAAHDQKGPYKEILGFSGRSKQHMGCGEISSYIYTYTYMYICVCVYIYICMYVSVCANICIYMYICTGVCMCVYIYIYVCVCVFRTWQRLNEDPIKPYVIHLEGVLTTAHMGSASVISWISNPLQGPRGSLEEARKLEYDCPLIPR